MKNDNQPTLFDTPPAVYHADFMPETERKALEINARSQEGRILNFLRMKKTGCGASYIWGVVKKDLEPITSIRRALTNLEKMGKVTKLEMTEMGIYGKHEHLYKITESTCV